MAYNIPQAIKDLLGSIHRYHPVSDRKRGNMRIKAKRIVNGKIVTSNDIRQLKRQKKEFIVHPDRESWDNACILATIMKDK